MSIDAPLTLKSGGTLNNRVAMAPLTNTQSHPDGTLGDDEYHWLMRRAEGGFGWISTCAAYVSDEGKAWGGQLGVAHPSHLEGLTRLATGLRAHGPAVVQLHHAGAIAELAPDRVSASATDQARAASIDDLQRIKQTFVEAAQRTEAAGFSGVEIHGANGYLFTQFLAPADNQRNDAYGGGIEGRARFLRETVQAVRAAVQPGFAVGVRLSPVDGYLQRGLVLKDSLQVGQWLAEDGADFVHLSLSDAAGPPPHEPDGPVVTTAFREALPQDVAVFSVGGIWTRADAKRAMDAGADVVVLGRAAMAHPDWPVASKAAGFAPVKPTWSRDYLKQAGLGDAFIQYITPFSGMVEGGAPARG